MRKLMNMAQDHMGVCEPTTILLLATTAYSVDQQKNAARDTKSARKAERRIQRAKQAREKRKQVREAQVSQAEITASGVASGTGGSSVTAGASGSVQSQLGENMSFLDSVQGLRDNQSIFMQKAADHTTSASISEAVGRAGVAASSLFEPKVDTTSLASGDK